mmetsp:Transcript_17977/g.32974  ORF Transcript_17977/g.32974 Transcript_17977/m.32974 type:complete len:200 (-) Transcript_17977:108-707(-)
MATGRAVKVEKAKAKAAGARERAAGARAKEGGGLRPLKHGAAVKVAKAPAHSAELKHTFLQDRSTKPKQTMPPLMPRHPHQHHLQLIKKALCLLILLRRGREEGKAREGKGKGGKARVEKEKGWTTASGYDNRRKRTAWSRRADLLEFLWVCSRFCLSLHWNRRCYLSLLLPVYLGSLGPCPWERSGIYVRCVPDIPDT